MSQTPFWIRLVIGRIHLICAVLFRHLRYDQTAASFKKPDTTLSLACSDRNVANPLLDSIGDWPNTPHLRGIVQAPSLRPDGSILQEAGYDVESGLFRSECRKPPSGFDW